MQSRLRNSAITVRTIFPMIFIPRLMPVPSGGRRRPRERQRNEDRYHLGRAHRRRRYTRIPESETSPNVVWWGSLRATSWTYVQDPAIYDKWAPAKLPRHSVNEVYGPPDYVPSAWPPLMKKGPGSHRGFLVGEGQHRRGTSPSIRPTKLSSTKIGMLSIR